MKKIVSIIALAVLLTAEVAAQPRPSRDTLPCGQRQRNHYYTAWLDTMDLYFHQPSHRYNPSHNNIIGLENATSSQTHTMVTYKQYAPRPIRIKGLWAMLSQYTPYGSLVSDTSRLPEYLYLYVRDTNEDPPTREKPSSYFLRRVATVRWDTARPKMMCIQQDAAGRFQKYYCHVYEALFDTVYTLSGEFWIGGSVNSNNQNYSSSHGLPVNPNWPSIYRILHASNIPPHSYNSEVRCTDPDGPWRYSEQIGINFGPFGAILDEQQWYVEVASADTAQGAGPSAYYPDSSYQTIRAIANSCYQFSHWNDGVTDNPRTVFVTQDTTFTAYFDTVPVFNVEVRSNDDDLGYAEVVEDRPPWDRYHRTPGYDTLDISEQTILENYYRRGSDSSYCKWDIAQIRAKAKNGYYFWYWNDGIATNHRFVSVTQDTLFTAIFSKDAPPPTCTEVTGMEATVDDSGRVWLTWASGVDGLHVAGEVAWGLDGTPAYQCNTRLCDTATVIDSLEKGRWYVAYVRGVCMHDSTEYYSDWSHGVRFYIPLDIKYTVTAETSDEERGYVEGGGTYDEGAVATLTAYGIQPYNFLQWNDGSRMNPRYVVVTQDTSFTAMFVNREEIATVDSLGSAFLLLPNPASGSVRCVMEGKPFPGGVLTMSDASGREVLHKELPPQTDSHTIMLAAYPKGVYFVTLTTAEGCSTQKLIVE